VGHPAPELFIFLVDYRQAAKARYNYKDQKYEGTVTDLEGNTTDVVNRSSFIMHHVVNIYPDTLAWIRTSPIHSMSHGQRSISGIRAMMTILLWEYHGCRHVPSVCGVPIS